ncbi:hypothetical protein GCM10010156_71380 [Planobispora rosea]|uniref:Rod shape-determining protein MreD n=1 Tax=Planobispora rosea TaxID=35762 RepID=A0A8J3WGJ8_PLARO|nr:rod shape-determining protein MreD [Planobispora rosea]GGT03212.1 hypothetical protein GCM10010156_71380 [Planobispora rosea]GIH88625.1 hypothetical protein Pro02_70330 [Planobispora rosea]
MTSRDTAGLILIVAVMIAQVTLVNRLPLPGGIAPDLALLVVVGFALVHGAEAGAITGFCAGLLGDVVPPAVHLTGEHALVLCLVGYAAGRVVEQAPDTGPLVALGGAAAGPVLAAVAGAAFGGVPVGPVVLADRLVPAVVCNVLAAPPVVWGVIRVFRGRTRVAERTEFEVPGRVRYGVRGPLRSRS